MIYDNLVKNLNNKAEVDNKVFLHFVRGAFVEIKGNRQANYQVKFFNNKNGRLLYSTDISNNMWTKCNIEYFIEWRIDIYENGKLWHQHIFNPENKRVYVALDSKALGDSLAWIPYVEEFGKVHNCKMVTSTFMNSMFEEKYPNIEFVNPGTNVENLYAMYCIGLFYNEDNTINIYKNPIDPKGQTMQKILYFHIFRNALMIVIAGLPATLLGIFFTSSMLIEVIFSLDGLGLLAYESAVSRDYPLIFASVYIFTLLGLISNIISDLTYRAIDPRIDFEKHN